MVAPASVGIDSGRRWRNKIALAAATVAREGDVCRRADTGGWFGVGINSGRRWRNMIALRAATVAREGDVCRRADTGVGLAVVTAS